MGAVDKAKGEDRERINSSRKIEDVFSAAVLDKIGAPTQEPLAIGDDFWRRAQVTAKSVTADVDVNGFTRPAAAFVSSAPGEVKYETSLSSSTDQGVSSDSPASGSNESNGGRLPQQSGSGIVPDTSVTEMANSVIDQHMLGRTAAGSSLLAHGGVPIPTTTIKGRVSFKQASTGATDAGLPTSQSTSEDDLHNGAALDERRQKRMLSNRESARRSRLRKQQHLDELRAEVDQLQAEKTSMVANYNAAAEQFSQLTRENTELRKHAEDLYQKISKMRSDSDFAAANWWRALDIDNGNQASFAPDHLSVYLQPSSQGAALNCLAG